MAKQGTGLAVIAFVTYILGGLGTFGGLTVIFFMPEKDFFGLGGGKGLGYLFVCVGLCLSLMGVLLMRVFRNGGFCARR